MKKLSLRLLVLVSLGSAYALQASEIETPLPGLYDFLRFPTEYFEEHEEHEECAPWKWAVNALGYARHADQGFPNCGPRGCTVPYAQLVFGVPLPFFLSTEFADGVPAGANPFLAFAQLNPILDYHEAGVIFNVTGENHFEYCDVPYRYGVTFRLPVRDIDVVNLAGNDFIIPAVDSVYQQRLETFDGVTNTVFAARLDFLASLNTAPVVPQPFVFFGDGVLPTTIAGQDVGVTIPVTATGIPGVGLIERADGTMPINDVWGALITNAQPILQADGSGIPQDGRGRFSDTINYASGAVSTDAAVQSELFVVPTLKGSDGTMSAGALAIQAAINAAVLNIPGSVFSFLQANGLDFVDGRNRGVGDLDVEFFLGRNWEYCDNEFWTDVKFVVRFPTADRLCNCKQLLRQPLGNNKHYEVMGGFAGGWDINERWKWMTDLTVSAVLKANEIVAAPFKSKDATIPKKIGPCITAQTHWWYLVFHTDVSVFACEGCGFDLGYELFFKSIDKVCLFQKTAIDFFGQEKPVDPTKLMLPITQRLANKARVAFFSKWNECEILAGWSYVFAGYNSPRDMDWYLSFTAYF